MSENLKISLGFGFLFLLVMAAIIASALSDRDCADRCWPKAYRNGINGGGPCMCITNIEAAR